MACTRDTCDAQHTPYPVLTHSRCTHCVSSHQSLNSLYEKGGGMSEAQVIETPPAHGPSFAVVVEIAERWSYRSCDRDRIVNPTATTHHSPQKPRTPIREWGVVPNLFISRSCHAKRSNDHGCNTCLNCLGVGASAGNSRGCAQGNRSSSNVNRMRRCSLN